MTDPLLNLKRSLQGAGGYVPGEQPQEEGFIKLNTNENPYTPSSRVNEAVAAACERLRLYPDPVSTKLRWMMGERCGVTADQVLAVNGSDEGLRLIFQTFVDEKDVVAAPYPTYVLYRVLARQFGARWMDVDFDDDFSLPAGLFDLAGKAKIIFLANPNSPSGTRIPAVEVRRLAERTKGLVIVDEAYADFAEENCLALVNDCPNVLVLRTLSKSYSLAGLRVGFMIGPRALIGALNVTRDSYNMDMLAQAGALAALEDQKGMKTNRDKILASRKNLTNALEGLGFRVWPSETNFVMCEPRGESLPAKVIYEELKRKKVLVRYFNERGMENRLRITVGRDEENEIFLTRLKEVLHAGG